MYVSCVSCKGKVKAISEVLEECKTIHCGRKTSVKFVVEGSENKSWRLTAFKEKVDAIVSDQQSNSIEDSMSIDLLYKYQLHISTTNSN